MNATKAAWAGTITKTVLIIVATVIFFVAKSNNWKSWTMWVSGIWAGLGWFEFLIYAPHYLWRMIKYRPLYESMPWFRGNKE